MLRKNDKRKQALVWLVKSRTVVGPEWISALASCRERKRHGNKSTQNENDQMLGLTRMEAIKDAARVYRKGIEAGLYPSPASLTLQAMELRKSSLYASHPVEAALRYHSTQTETPGEAGDDCFDF